MKPYLKKNERRWPYVVRLSADEKKGLLRAAKKAKLAPAVYARQAILRATFLGETFK